MRVFIVNYTSLSGDDCGVANPSIKNYYVPEDCIEELHAHAEHGIIDMDFLHKFLDKHESLVADVVIVGVVNIAVYYGSYTTVSWEMMLFGNAMDSECWSNEGMPEEEG